MSDSPSRLKTGALTKNNRRGIRRTQRLVNTRGGTKYEYGMYDNRSSGRTDDDPRHD